ncbi:MAG TPA: transcription elongation factor GreA, partial [Alphaproteobacteria bacterium]|nr:transcription elongation factor GreA [Alphaproteobacteria bacterium]
MDKLPMTLSGYERLQQELKQLKTVERTSVIKAIAEAREHGDLSENAEYHAAKERQSFIEGRIVEIEDKISRAEIIDVSKITGDEIKFGATITLCDDDT